MASRARVKTGKHDVDVVRKDDGKVQELFTVPGNFIPANPDEGAVCKEIRYLCTRNQRKPVHECHAALVGNKDRIH